MAKRAGVFPVEGRPDVSGITTFVVEQLWVMVDDAVPAPLTTVRARGTCIGG